MVRRVSPTCPLCGSVDVDLECWAVAGSPAWLCPGCVASARANGYHVVWLPDRMRPEEADAFREALVTQATIMERQAKARPEVPHGPIARVRAA